VESPLYVLAAYEVGMQEEDLFGGRIIETDNLFSAPATRSSLALGTSLDEHLGLRPVTAVHLPVPLNFVFVGFKGEGKQNVELSAKEVLVRYTIEGFAMTVYSPANM
jgi:hypothetical protein